MAKRINISSGGIYWAFDRDQHVKEFDRDFSRPVWCGMDFNVDPYTACFGYVVGDHLYIFDEFYEQDFNTHKAAEKIAIKYGTQMTIVPDYSGTGRRTSANGETDHKILRNRGFVVKSSTNPFRIDRYNCVNSLLERGKVTIHPRCKYLIRDLEQVCYKEGDNVPDISNKDLTHSSDGFGYLVYKLFPIKIRDRHKSFSVKR